MNSGKRRLKRGAKKRLLRRFTTIMLSTFTAGIIIVLGGLATYQHLSEDGNVFDGFTKLSAEEKKVKKEEKNEEKLKTNVAVFGVDIDGYRTDSMFVVHFDGEQNSAALVSVPRDTQIRLSDSEYDKMRSMNKRAPRTMKLNEMTAYAGMKNIRETTVNQIEKLLGITIDNYVTIEIEAFRKIVDHMGGVTVDVPMRMYYNDYSQKLHIDLKPGVQLLDGDKAEQMVRFRKSSGKGSGGDGSDTGRIDVQQVFFKAFAEQLLSKENIPNLPKMVPAMFQHVKTDINILDLPKYYGYASSFDTNAIGFHTVPGKAEYQNNVSYFFPDMDEIDSFVQGVFYKSPESQIAQSEIGGRLEVVEDKSVKIEILNGGGPGGAASNLREIIREDGYDVINIANHKGTIREDVVIYAKDTSQAQQFKSYFDRCTIAMDDSLRDEVDIQIIIGSNGI